MIDGPVHCVNCDYTAKNSYITIRIIYSYLQFIVIIYTPN